MWNVRIAIHQTIVSILEIGVLAILNKKNFMNEIRNSMNELNFIEQ